MTAAMAPKGAFAPKVAVAAKPVAAAPAVIAAPAAVAPKPVAAPKGAVTPKGERRRYALVSAAAELLREGGFEAVRHRAVARRAGLPLASTTYYFSSLDDLIASAVAHIGMLEVAQLRAQVTTLSRRRRSADTTADLLVDLLVGGESETRLTEQLISRYERHIACARLPGLREIQRRSLRQRVDAVAEVIEKSGRSVRPELVSALICTVDGAVVSALVDDRQDPRAVARATVIDVIDAVAPFDRRPMHV
ncbi:TetR/AcrR family transcriptional regulator [Mycobacterium sp.]|uniref:TetR/AcrR family transcriptional regulator n=1 Tax=Mycobacterium sp. TaxID=1785 RepID=UPI003BAE4234